MVTVPFMPTAHSTTSAEKLFGRRRAGEFQPSVEGRVYAWQRVSPKEPNRFDVFVRRGLHGEASRVNRKRFDGALGDIDGTTLVYQEFRGSSSDLMFFDVDSGDRSRPPAGVNSPRWEYWPSVSGRWLLFGQLDRHQRRIVLVDLITGDRQVLDSVRGHRSLYPGQVNGDWAVWQRCRSTERCDIVRYDLATDRREVVVNPRPRGLAPSIESDGDVVYARAGSACGSRVTFVRESLDDTVETLTTLPSGQETATSDVGTVDDSGATEIVFDRFRCNEPYTADVWGYAPVEAATLRVTVEGAGVVTSSPTGIDCGSDCIERFDEPTDVTLTATPEAGAVFVGWAGACTGSAPTCDADVHGETAVTATFATGTTTTTTPPPTTTTPPTTSTPPPLTGPTGPTATGPTGGPPDAPDVSGSVVPGGANPV